MSHPQPSYDPIWRMSDVCHQAGLSRSTIYRLIDNGDFPQSIPLSKKSIGFLSSEIVAWKEQRVANARQGQEA